MSVQAAAPMIDGLTLVREIGAGGYSRVYLYRMERPRLEVAVKVMDADLLADDLLERFMAEANAMAELSHHPYIAQVHRADVTRDGRPYIVMKHYPGETYAVRAKTSPFSVSETLRAGVRIACAIETAHRSGILHRDIKPANILTDQYDIPALTDFGIALASDQTRSSAEGMSLPWAPPEVVFSTGEPGVASDIYSLGATLWHLLVGRSPFAQPGGDNSTGAVMRRIESAPPPSVGRSDAPRSLEHLLASCMAKTPTARPSSALDIAHALQAIEQEQHLTLTPLALLETTPLRARPTDGDDRTEMRAPRVMNPQPVVDAARPEAPPRVRVLPGASVAEETIRRSGVSEPAAEDEVSPRSLGGPRRRLLIAAAVVAACGVGVTFVLLSSSGSPTTRTEKQPVIPQSLGVAASPGTPVVRVVRLSRNQKSDVVVFRWAGYPNELASDTYRWRRSGSAGTGRGVARRPTLRVAVRRGATACVAVQVIRSNGTEPSSLSDPTCIG